MMGRIESFHRPLDPSERLLVELLLKHPFPGRDELVDQLATVTVKRIDENGSLSFEKNIGRRARACEVSNTDRG
jgi:hypothetical protein